MQAVWLAGKMDGWMAGWAARSSETQTCVPFVRKSTYNAYRRAENDAMMLFQTRKYIPFVRK